MAPAHEADEPLAEERLLAQRRRDRLRKIPEREVQPAAAELLGRQRPVQRLRFDVEAPCRPGQTPYEGWPPGGWRRGRSARAVPFAPTGRGRSSAWSRPRVEDRPARDGSVPPGRARAASVTSRG